MTYREKEDLRSDISILREIIQYFETERPELTRRQILEATAKQKRRIREKMANIYTRDEMAEIIVHVDEDGEGWIIKEWYDCPFTEEDKKEYMEWNWQRINSPYDCTGLAFTQWIEIFNVETSFGAKAVVYHAKGLDV